MANVHHALRHLIHVDAAKAGAQILRAVDEAGGHKSNAAKILGCTHGTLLAWIKKCGLEAQVDKVVEKAKAEGRFVVEVGHTSGPRKYEVVDRKTGIPIGPGGFVTMASAQAKAAENPKQWRAQKKPSAKARQARSRAGAAA